MLVQQFFDRNHAGKILAELLQAYRNNPKVIVLGLPRGGVPVAYEIAQSLEAPLDVFIVRKLGVPGAEEFAFGALASNNIQVLNAEVVKNLHLSEEVIYQVVEREKQELVRREKLYRHHKSLDLTDKIVILVDDGIATGATLRAAIKALQQLPIARLIVAVPVAQEQVCNEMAKQVDEMVCVLKPAVLQAVGEWYSEFGQVSDEEVCEFLS